MYIYIYDISSLRVNKEPVAALYALLDPQSKPSKRRQIYTGRYGVSGVMAHAISRHHLQTEARV